MQNRWKASVTQSETTENDANVNSGASSNSSKKIGIAMGVVGALLVAAGTVPMIFSGDSADLTGDITQTEEAVDPLVALLSGGDTQMAAATPRASQESSPAVNTPSPKSSEETARNTPVTTPKSTPSLKPTPTQKTSSTPASEIDKILEEEGESVAVTNSNTGKQDKNGSAFGTVTDDESLHGAALSNTSSQPTPKTTVQTGSNTPLLIGFLLMIVAGMMIFTSVARRR